MESEEPSTPNMSLGTLSSAGANRRKSSRLHHKNEVNPGRDIEELVSIDTDELNLCMSVSPTKPKRTDVPEDDRYDEDVRQLIAELDSDSNNEGDSETAASQLLMSMHASRDVAARMEESIGGIEFHIINNSLTVKQLNQVSSSALV